MVLMRQMLFFPPSFSLTISLFLFPFPFNRHLSNFHLVPLLFKLTFKEHT